MVTLKFYRNNDAKYGYAVTIKTGRAKAAYGCSYVLGERPDWSSACFKLLNDSAVKPETAGLAIDLAQVPKQILRDAWRLAGQLAGIAE